MTQEQALRTMESYVMANVRYDWTLRHISWIDAVMTGTTVCCGFAELMLVICKILGIPCFYAEGTLNRDGTLHAWNIIYINGKECYADMTWFADGVEWAGLMEELNDREETCRKQTLDQM